ncbi:MAG: tail fiber domain-containing protein [Verrucomicrobiota bacterium]
MKPNTINFHSSLVALAILVGVNRGSAQGTAFTYQGQLSDNGIPASGSFDLQFVLYNGSQFGSQAGPSLTNSGVSVTNGLFTTTLDFGAGIFTGTNLWLDISVRTNGAGAFNELLPRQPLTPTPYSVMANSASNLLGEIPLAQLPGAVLTNDESNAVLGNVTIGDSLTLPFPVTIYTDGGTSPILHGDGNKNFFAGLDAGYSLTSGYGNEGVGTGALYTDTSGSYNVANGYGALESNLNGNNNTANGFDALDSNISGGDNTANGDGALYGNLIGNENVAEGSGALEYSTNDNELVAIGYQALQNDNAFDNGDITSGSGANTGVGYQALQYDTLGYGNTAIGYLALNQNLNGAFNTASGIFALNENTSGNFNSAYGFYALVNNTSGSENTALGYGVLISNTNGNSNIALGAGAGGSLTSGNNNIYIGNYGASMENGVIRIGTPGTQTITYLPGALNVDESGLNVGKINSNALTFGVSSGEGILSKRVSGTVNSYDLELWTDFNSRLTVLQNGDVGIGTTNPIDAFEVASGGVAKMTLDSSGNLECAGTVYSKGIALTSDRNAKENFTPVDNQAVLAKVVSLPVTEWNYKTDNKGVQHIGPMAQDFQAAFRLDGTDDKHISVVDEGGVALAAIQGLNQKLNDRDAEIQTLKQQNDSLADRLNELETRVKQLAANK